MAAKRPLIIAGTALAGLLLVAVARPVSVPAQPPRPDRRPTRARKSAEVPAPPPAASASRELPTSQQPPPAEASIPGLKDIPHDGDLAAPWLLGLADPEFKKLIGTRELDQIVGLVMERLMARRTDYDRPGEVEEYVERLNARIRALQD